MLRIFYFSFLAALFSFTHLFAQMKVQEKLSDNEKEFIAAKISKIQADYDKLLEYKKMYEGDSVIFPDRRSLLDFYDNLGRNCFGLNSDEEEQTYDIITEKIYLDGMPNNDFTIFHSFMSDRGKQYFIAVDDSGKVYLLDNFWCDEFNKFILNKLGVIDNKEKALSAAKVLIATKYYSPSNGEKIVLTEDNIKTYRSKYPYLQPAKISQDEKDNFDITLYTYSPYSEEIICFNLVISKNVNTIINQKVVNESVATD